MERRKFLAAAAATVLAPSLMHKGIADPVMTGAWDVVVPQVAGTYAMVTVDARGRVNLNNGPTIQELVAARDYLFGK